VVGGGGRKRKRERRVRVSKMFLITYYIILIFETNKINLY